MPVRLYPPHRLDIEVADLFAAVRPRRIRAHDGELYCQSVRSGLHLLLTALELPSGSEVIVSAITHPDMIRILELHELRAVPADISIDDLSVAPAELERCFSPRTRAVLFAHLFGARADLDSTIDFAHRRELIVIEDCAQVLIGPDDRGHERADASLFSYGFIKRATALGGARVCVGNASLRTHMRAVHEEWPRETPTAWWGRALKALPAGLLSRPGAYGLLRRAGLRPTDWFYSARRNDDAFRAWLERRPSRWQLNLLERRRQRFPAARLIANRSVGEQLRRALPLTLRQPGRALDTTHWLFPVLSADPEALVAHLARAGFEASRGTSRVCTVGGLNPNANAMMERIVFVPVYPEMHPVDRERLAATLRSFNDRAPSRPNLPSAARSSDSTRPRIPSGASA